MTLKVIGRRVWAHGHAFFEGGTRTFGFAGMQKMQNRMALGFKLVPWLAAASVLGIGWNVFG